MKGLNRNKTARIRINRESNADPYEGIRERTYKDVVADIAELLLHLLPVFLGHLLVALAYLQNLDKVMLQFFFLKVGSGLGFI